MSKTIKTKKEMDPSMSPSEGEESLLRTLFIEESRSDLAKLEGEILQLSDPAFESDQIDYLFRTVHSLKGGAAILGESRLVEFCHHFESSMVAIRSGVFKPNRSTVSLFLEGVEKIRFLLDRIEDENRIDPRQEEELQDLERRFSELETQAEKHSQIQNHARSDQHASVSKQSSPHHQSHQKQRSLQPRPQSMAVVHETHIHELTTITLEFAELFKAASKPSSELNTVLVKLGPLIDRLQRTTEEFRKIPLRHILTKLPKLVLATAEKTEKKVLYKLESATSDLSVNKKVAKSINQCLTHLIRNAIDHGIEKPIERQRLSKNETGTITVRVSRSSGHLLIEVSDDGKGIDREKLVAEAIRRGLMTRNDAHRLTPREIDEFIFFPGFSTAEALTDISGRGVGMDVVKTLIQELKGSIEVKSQLGEGTRISLSIPETEQDSQLGRKKMKSVA